MLCVHIVTLIYANPCKYFVRRFADDVRTLLLLLSTSIHYARTLFDRSYLVDHSLVLCWSKVISGGDVLWDGLPIYKHCLFVDHTTYSYATLVTSDVYCITGGWITQRENTNFMMKLGSCLFNRFNLLFAQIRNLLRVQKLLNPSHLCWSATLNISH